MSIGGGCGRSVEFGIHNASGGFNNRDDEVMEEEEEDKITEFRVINTQVAPQDKKVKLDQFWGDYAMNYKEEKVSLVDRNDLQDP